MKRRHRKRMAIVLLVLYLTLTAWILIGMSGARAEVKPSYADNGLPWATVNAWDVCFREGPGREYRVVQHWSMGAAVEVLGEQDGWVQVLRWTSPEPLWVWHEYLTMVQGH